MVLATYQIETHHRHLQLWKHFNQCTSSITLTLSGNSAVRSPLSLTRKGFLWLSCVMNTGSSQPVTEPGLFFEAFQWKPPVTVSQHADLWYLWLPQQNKLVVLWNVSQWVNREQTQIKTTRDNLYYVYTSNSWQLYPPYDKRLMCLTFNRFVALLGNSISTTKQGRRMLMWTHHKSHLITDMSGLSQNQNTKFNVALLTTQFSDREI